MSPPTTQPFWGYGEVQDHTGLARQTLYSLKSRGEMPAPAAYDERRRPLWRPADIRAWHARPRGRGQQP